MPAYRLGMIVLPHRDVHRVRHLFNAEHLTLAVAEKLGFRKIETYSVFVGNFGETQAAQ